MKPVFVFTFTLLLVTNIAMASGNYKRQTQQSPPATHLPYEKSEKSLKSYIYDIDRKNVSVHNVSLEGKTFKVKGNFSNEIDFDKFVERLKGNGEVDREIKVSKEKDNYPGSTSYSFEVTGTNIWK